MVRVTVFKLQIKILISSQFFKKAQVK